MATLQFLNMTLQPDYSPREAGAIHWQEHGLDGRNNSGANWLWPSDGGE